MTYLDHLREKYTGEFPTWLCRLFRPRIEGSWADGFTATCKRCGFSTGPHICRETARIEFRRLHV